MTKSPLPSSAFEHLFPNDKRWFTPSEFAELIGKSAQYVRDAISSGMLMALDFSALGQRCKGRRPRYSISREEAIRFFSSCSNSSANQIAQTILDLINTYGEGVRNKIKEHL